MKSKDKAQGPREKADEDVCQTPGSKDGNAVDSFRMLPQSRFFYVYVHDFEGNFLDANEVALNRFGYSREDLQNMNIASLLSGDDLHKARETLEEIKRTGQQTTLTRYRLKPKKGDWIWVDTEGFLIYRQGKPFAVQGIALDVTAQVCAEEELRRYQEQLEDLVAERTASLQKMSVEFEEKVRDRTKELEKAYSELQRLDRTKDEFLALVSHELRTPLTSIRSFSEILLRYENDPETLKEFLTIINTESERLTRLINNLLDFAKIEAGAVTWHDRMVSVEEVVKDAARALRNLVLEKRLEIRLDLSPGLPFVYADRDRVHQVVTNLLSNAIKFSSEEGEIRVKAEGFTGKRWGETSEWIKVSVCDQGIGIDGENFETIFHRFRQVSPDPGREKPKGTGLGLAICKEIISHYGGNIWVESEKGKGSTFCFTLPQSHSPSEEP